MGAYDQGAFTPYDYLPSVRIPIYGIAMGSFVNRTPLFTRLPQAPLGALSFVTSTVLFRPSSTTLNNGGAVAAGATSIVVADASMFQTGDTIEVDAEEYLITGVNTATNALTVVPGYAGTTTAGHADLATVYLISNTRTGGEINVYGISRVPTALAQYAQTFQHPYHVGGSLASATDYALPPGVASVVGRERMMAMQDCSDDVERAMYYSRPVPITSTTSKPAQAGLRTQLVTNKTLQPTNYNAYKPSDLIRDTLSKVYGAGGDPNVLLMSTDWMSGLSTWGQPLVRIEAGSTKLGVAIDEFEAPFLSGVSIIPAPLLRPGTVICLSSSEVRNRVKRNLFDKPRGSQGDADQGDILYEGAIEVDNESHHAWVSGITNWVAS